MARFWPTADADPASTAIIVRDVDPDQIRELKAQPGGDLALGGVELAATFLAQDLVGEFRIYVHPVLLGRGRPLFATPGELIGRRLVETRAFGNGVVLLRDEREVGAAN